MAQDMKGWKLFLEKVALGAFMNQWYEREDKTKEQRRIDLMNRVGFGEESEDYIDYCSEGDEEYSRNFGEHRRVVRGTRFNGRQEGGGESEEYINRGNNEEEDTGTDSG